MKNENRKTNKTKFLARVMLVALLLTSSVLSGCEWELNKTEESSTTTSTTITTTTTTTTATTTKKPIDLSDIIWEEKVYCYATVEDHFEPGYVLVLIDKAISEPNKEFEKEFFAGVEIESIIDLSRTSHDSSYFEEFRQMLVLVLVDKTKEAVIEAIQILQQIDGIKAAEPSYIPDYNNVPNDPYYSFGNNANDQ